MSFALSVAEVFGLPAPIGAPIPIQQTDLETWRLDTADGSYVVKRLWRTEQSARWSRVEQAMSLENKAIAAGLDTAVPVEPVDPVVGWATVAGEHGCFRVHRWLEHRALTDSDEIADWLGRTVARLHTLSPTEQPIVREGSTFGMWESSVWAEWIRQAHKADKPWATIAERRLSDIAVWSDRLRATYADPPDRVTTHGDLERHNVLVTPTGPVLIDWDTVWVYSAALQAGRVAYAFGAGQVERIRAVLRSYVDAGGSVGWAGSALFTSTISHELAATGALIAAVLGAGPVAPWMNLDTADDRIGSSLDRLPDYFDELTDVALRCQP